MKLYDAIRTLSLDELRALAKTYNLSLSRNPMRFELVDALFRVLSDPATVQSTIAGLSDLARQALDDLAAHGGRMDVAQFISEYGNVQPALPYGYWLNVRASATEELRNRGLIYRVRDAKGGRETEVFLAPDEVLACLAGGVRRAFVDMLEPSAPPTHPDPVPDLDRDIFLLLCYLQRNPVRAVRGNRLSKRDLARLNAEMSWQQDMSNVQKEEDARWLHLVHQMAAQLELVSVQGGMITPSEKAERWLAKPRPERIRHAWHQLLKDGSQTPLPALASDDIAARVITARHIIAAQQRIVENIKRCPVEQWLTIGSFSRAVRTWDKSLLRGDRSLYYYPTAIGWQALEHALIEAFVSQTLAAFGIVQTGRDAPTREPHVFRVTRLGAVLLGMIKEDLPVQPAGKITVQPNFEIVAPPETPGDVLYRMQRIADLVKRDKASIYVLSQDALWRFLQAGHKVEEAISFLEAAAQRPLPQNVAYTLRDWATRYGELTIEQATIVVARTKELMAEARTNKKVGMRVQREIAPHVVIVDSADVSVLLDQLRKAGYWPQAGAGCVPAVPVADTKTTEIAITTGDLTLLVAGALVLRHMAEHLDWHAPVSDTLVRRLSWRLPPRAVNEARRMAREALAQLQTWIGLTEEQGDEV